jgi:gustatory receptor
MLTIDVEPCECCEVSISSSDARLFENAIKVPMKIARVFGVFPSLSRWKYFSSIYCGCITMLHVAVVFSVIYKRYELGYIEAHSAVGFFFYINSTVVWILFYKLNFQWKTVINHWSYVEKTIFLTNKYRSTTNWSLSKKIYGITIVGYCAALLEHVLFIANGLKQMHHEVEYCGYKEDMFEMFFHRYHSHIFQLIPYNLFAAVVVEFLNFSLNFIWSFNGFFIVFVSIGISFRFDQINRRVEFYRGRIVPDSTWREIRSHYTELCELLRMIDVKIGSIICMACLNDFYFLISNILNASE